MATDGASRTVVEFANVSKRFRGKDGIVDALRDISLDIAEREFVAVVGPSGCGKTTLVRLIAGLTPPSVGQVRVDGIGVTQPPRNVGLMFQSPVLLPWRSVMSNVLLPIEFQGRDARQYREKAEALLHLTDLHNFRNSYPHELSGGMQQRVALVRTLLYDPDVLLLDEPFGALDALTREEMNIELERIWERQRKTAVLITHSVSEAVFLADRVVLISRRPGTIRSVFKIDLPRPRSRTIRYTEKFRTYEQAISEELLGQVREN